MIPKGVIIGFNEWLQVNSKVKGLNKFNTERFIQ